MSAWYVARWAIGAFAVGFFAGWWTLIYLAVIRHEAPSFVGWFQLKFASHRSEMLARAVERLAEDGTTDAHAATYAALADYRASMPRRGPMPAPKKASTAVAK